MGQFTRRSVVATGASAVLAANMPGWARRAAAQAVRTRHSTASPQGKAMLALYARAVGLMMNQIPKGDPRNWDFQWYSHWIPGPQRPWPDVAAKKTQTVQTVYPGKPPTDPQRRLAEAMWDGCQAHGNNPNDPGFFQEQFFLPWHRYFVYYFEEIIRGVLQDATFTLPYWDYLGGPPGSTSLPPELRDATSPLFRADRNPGVNAGQPIDVGPGRTALNANAFRETVYIKSTPFGDIGFCPQLDGNPHGAVHVDVGTTTNMGRIPFAGGDPAFWLHHCNIDRLWESWNRLPGRTNPAWPDRSFPFANANGGPVSAPVAGANRVALLNYQYDNYYVPPGIPDMAVAGQVPAAAALAATSPSEVRAMVGAPVTLGTGPVRAALTSPAAPLAGVAPFALKAPPVERNLYLMLSGIDVPTDPGDVVYDVYLDLPEGTAPSPSLPNYVGALNFFNAAVGHDHAGGHGAAYNVTDTVNALQAAGRLSGRPTVTFAPNGEVKGDARPTVRDVALVET